MKAGVTGGVVLILALSANPANPGVSGRKSVLSRPEVILNVLVDLGVGLS